MTETFCATSEQTKVCVWEGLKLHNKLPIILSLVTQNHPHLE